MIKRINIHLKYSLILVFSIILGFRNLPNSFFEQDEWHSFGYYIHLQSLSFKGFVMGVLQSGGLIHFTPLSLLTKMTMFNLFELNAAYYFYISIFLHISVALLLYKLLTRLTKNPTAALIGSLFFALNSSHHQGVTWLGTFEGVELSTFFGLLAILFFLKTESLLKTLPLLIISILFKENGFIFLLSVLLIHIYSSKSITQKFRELRLPIFLIIVYIFLRLVIIMGNDSISASTAKPFSVRPQTIVYNIFTLTPKLYSQALIPQQLIINFGNQIPYPRAMQVFSTIIGFFLFFSAYKTLVKRHQSLLLFLGLSILTAFSILPVSTAFGYTDSRYFYTYTIAISIVLSTIYLKQKRFSRLLIFILILLHIFYLQDTIHNLISWAKIRKSVLAQVNDKLQALPQDSIVYIESDTPYYGLAERILPFQSGFGQVLLVNYHLKYSLPSGFYTEEFLWDIKSQGYKKINDFGFGFYNNKKDLKLFLEKENYDIGKLKAFHFESEGTKLIDTTNQIRNEMQISGKGMIPISLSKDSLVNSQNQDDLEKAIDQDPGTFWSSKEPYYLPQHIDIDLGEIKTISLIKIVSQDPNQNETGYEVFVSTDNVNWIAAFRQNRSLNTPSDIDSLYLLPMPARFVKLRQIGYHKFAPWVINELTLYETN